VPDFKLERSLDWDLAVKTAEIVSLTLDLLETWSGIVSHIYETNLVEQDARVCRS
jgi:hypothetical protein